MHLLFLLHLLSTAFMTGLVWFVQLVHYPLMREVSPGNFARFEGQHTRLTSLIVAPAMLLELFSGLLYWYVVIGRFDVTGAFTWNMILLLLIWASTFFVQIPLHRRLTQGFAGGTHRRLVRTNWVRTVLWSVRLVLLASLIELAG